MVDGATCARAPDVRSSRAQSLVARQYRTCRKTVCKSSSSCRSGKSNPKITRQSHYRKYAHAALAPMQLSASFVQYFHLCAYVHTLNSRKKAHRCPLTQWTRAHYRWQIFALELAAFVYPAALSTETEFGRGWKRTKRGSATNSISSKATSFHSVTGAWHPPPRLLPFEKLFRPAPGFDKHDAAAHLNGLCCKAQKNYLKDVKLWFLFSTIFCGFCFICTALLKHGQRWSLLQ